MNILHVIYFLFYQISNQKSKEEIEQWKQFIEDPIVKGVSFEPLSKVGNNFTTHSIKEDKNGNIILRYSPIALTIHLILIIAFFIFADYARDRGITIDFVFIGTFVFTTIAMVAVFSLLQKGFSFIFDFEHGYFYAEGYYNNFHEVIQNPKFKRHFVPIEAFHALQIVQKKVFWKTHGFVCYELNIILKNGQRINILNNSNGNSIKEIAQNISSKTGLRIYDITQ